MDIHNVDDRLERAERNLGTISPKNAKLVREFENYGFSASLSKSRITKYILTLKKLAQWLKIDFDAAKKNDIERLVRFIETGQYSPWTRHDYKVALKFFFKWLKGNGEDYPPEVTWI